MADNTGKTTSAKPWLGKLRGASHEARERFLTDQRQREAADRAPQSIILDPKRLAGQNWDAGTVLHTTLGGVKRPITANDLAAFRRNIGQLRGRLGLGGITARQVIDLSDSYLAPGKGTDLKRARREIHHAVPAGFNRGELHLITNAGPESKDTRHHVKVVFPLFDVAVGDANLTEDQAARWLVKQPLKFDCDCGRHRYFFRYTASAGGFNAGRAEHGYPKIRNPNLIGVACKHVVRAMSDLESSPSIRNILARGIAKMRDKDVVKKRIDATQKAADANAAGSERVIRTSDAIALRNRLAREKSAARAAARHPATPAPRPRRGLLSKAKDLAASVASRFGIVKAAAMKILNRFIR